MITRWYLRREPGRQHQVWLQVDEVAGGSLPRGLTCRVFDRLDARAQLPVLRRALQVRIDQAAQPLGRTFSPLLGDV